MTKAKQEKQEYIGWFKEAWGDEAYHFESFEDFTAFAGDAIDESGDTPQEFAATFLLYKLGDKVAFEAQANLEVYIV